MDRCYSSPPNLIPQSIDKGTAPWPYPGTVDTAYTACTAHLHSFPATSSLARARPVHGRVRNTEAPGARRGAVATEPARRNRDRWKRAQPWRGSPNRSPREFRTFSTPIRPPSAPNRHFHYRSGHPIESQGVHRESGLRRVDAEEPYCTGEGPRENRR